LTSAMVACVDADSCDTGESTGAEVMGSEGSIEAEVAADRELATQVAIASLTGLASQGCSLGCSSPRYGPVHRSTRMRSKLRRERR